VREILVRGDGPAVRWLRALLSPGKIRDLVRRYAGAACSEPERRKLRAILRLSVEELPVRDGSMQPDVWR
jgi:hypothetical protein